MSGFSYSKTVNEEVESPSKPKTIKEYKKQLTRPTEKAGRLRGIQNRYMQKRLGESDSGSLEIRNK